MKKTIVSKQWIGGSPRVTISISGEVALIKLLNCYSVNGTARQRRFNICDTLSTLTVKLPKDHTVEILNAALELSRRARNCWVWDSNDIGVADLYNSTQCSDAVNIIEQPDDELGF